MTPIYGDTPSVDQLNVRVRAYQRTKRWRYIHSKLGIKSVKIQYYKLNKGGDTLEVINE